MRWFETLREYDMANAPDPDSAPDEESRPIFRELEIVRLVRPFKTISGIIPRGYEATILQVFAGGSAY